MSSLLDYHKHVLELIHDPLTSDLVVLARGLGLRRIVCTLLKICDTPQNLVLLVNATQEEEAEIGEELGIMGCRKPGLRIVSSNNIGGRDRKELYKHGGLISVTSVILDGDLLNSEVPTELITGIVFLHAERVKPPEELIVRLYREKNKTGFLKAFTDQPEHIMSGLSPLKTIMTALQLRRVHIYPRFHEDVKASLERRQADVIKLSQPLTETMADIHHSIIQCMTTTLSELKRSNTTLDLDDFNVENAYFKSFDVIVRRQLDPVWHKVGPKTKQLVSDLGTLRRLLYYLVTYDPLQFHAYLETLRAANTINPETGNKHQNPSPWMLSNHANVIFTQAKRRCFVITGSAKNAAINLVNNDDEWDALDELEGRVGVPSANNTGNATDGRPHWVPKSMDPILEELPKWELLANVLQEIEVEMMRQESLGKRTPANVPGSNTVLIMASSTRICNLLTEFLSTMDPTARPGSHGRAMMLRKLRLYLWWKAKLTQRKQDGKSHFAMPDGKRPADGKLYGSNEGLSEALKKKDEERAQRNASRRRVRGGAPGGGSSHQAVKVEGVDTLLGETDASAEIQSFAEFWSTQNGNSEMPISLDEDVTIIDFDSTEFLEEYDAHYGLVKPEQMVLVRAYSDDSDDRMLQEIQPKFIVMFEPNMEFIRRVEVYRSSNPGLAVRVYHMVYQNSCEEHKYLAGIRREKDSFERLIKERATMLLPILEEQRAGPGDALLRTINTRVAGGRREIDQTQSQVVLDQRELRSALPNLLHKSGLLLLSATLTVGDYVLTPDICVERKSLPDLISSFNSGRLFTQCEFMCTHYKQPVLLIEFEEHKAFSLDIVSDMKSYAKPSNKFPPKKKPGSGPSEREWSAPTLQSKIVLLTLSFPKVRIIWSSSPEATAEIFNDLKLNNPQPTRERAVTMGADNEVDVAGNNTAAEELLRSLPGINDRNVRLVMKSVKSVRHFAEMSVKEVQNILGEEQGKLCWEFMHKGED